MSGTHPDRHLCRPCSELLALLLLFRLQHRAAATELHPTSFKCITDSWAAIMERHKDCSKWNMKLWATWAVLSTLLRVNMQVCEPLRPSLPSHQQLCGAGQPARLLSMARPAAAGSAAVPSLGCPVLCTHRTPPLERRRPARPRRPHGCAACLVAGLQAASRKVDADAYRGGASTCLPASQLAYLPVACKV